ncbi:MULTISPECIES: TetR family transcriptional regulator [Microbacterium]|uniref:TetR/AcrR family transcriptional regulator n=1 Tax=Microbacterium wangchenii TaxID=2541726 RepID=A0ABX5SX53_9MICO|nr:MULTISPECIES: TetR family transcriptional regulator [Microbacterium]MCK6067695.1 TetR family transcriptional regulator [Microbacterium sp. EYE_512]QBR89390.1 TetR/AcrR family transcriptional regulator [Microbacterium wangchenii]TXK11063.1 helix-turn-helix transcriptional regulator [Microbacterium wangchenii]
MGQRDASATRARILSAAVAEFAAHGYSGGRVERIAKEAESNVRMIYAYFGNKSGLFDAALSDAIVRMAEEVPPQPSDLPGWVGDLFDFHQRRPEVLRICLWAQLERPDAASEPLETYLAKVESVQPQAPTAIGAVNLLVIIYAVAQAWQLAPIGLLAADAHADTDTRRAAAVEAVTRILA